MLCEVYEVLGAGNCGGAEYYHFPVFLCGRGFLYDFLMETVKFERFS